MCDDALRNISNKSASQQDSTSSDAVATPTINNFADLKLAMSEMMSSFKTELLTHVNQSISQVYQDFEQVAEPVAQDETIGVSEVEPLPEESGAQSCWETNRLCPANGLATTNTNQYNYGEYRFQSVC